MLILSAFFSGQAGGLTFAGQKMVRLLGHTCSELLLAELVFCFAGRGLACKV
jgi:hypothetical protein